MVLESTQVPTILDNFEATTNPTVNDDDTQGYSVGSQWVNVTTDEAFICVDDSIGAAKWPEIGGAGSGVHVATVDPTPNDDGSSGFQVGSLWLNKTTYELWVSIDDTASNAVWVGVSGVLSSSNQDMPAQTTVSDEDLACATAVAYTPTKDGLIKVLVNGIAVKVGDGSKVAPCYFSNDGGTNVRNIKDVQAGDKLYWVGSQAGFELKASSDSISFIYVAQEL